MTCPRNRGSPREPVGLIGLGAGTEVGGRVSAVIHWDPDRTTRAEAEQLVRVLPDAE